ANHHDPQPRHPPPLNRWHLTPSPASPTVARPPHPAIMDCGGSPPLSPKRLAAASSTTSGLHRSPTPLIDLDRLCQALEGRLREPGPPALRVPLGTVLIEQLLKLPLHLRHKAQNVTLGLKEK